MIIEPQDQRYPRLVSKSQEEAGKAWWIRVSSPGDRVIDVARRLGIPSAQVSAYRHGRLAPPTLHTSDKD